MYNIFHCQFCGDDYAIAEEYNWSPEIYNSFTNNAKNWKPHNCKESKDINRREQIKKLNKFEMR